MFGRKAKRIAELERRVSVLRDSHGRLVDRYERYTNDLCNERDDLLRRVVALTDANWKIVQNKVDQHSDRVIAERYQNDEDA